MEGHSYLIETGGNPKYVLSKRYYYYFLSAGEAGLRRVKKYWPNFVNVWVIHYINDEQMPVLVDYLKFKDERRKKNLRPTAARRDRRLARVRGGRDR